MAPERILDQAVRKAAETMFADREVQVESFRDEGSGRLVYRIADRTSGEVIHQSPSDDLLRFFASGRSPGDGPIVHLEA